VETEAYGHRLQRERYFLAREELAHLLRALQGPLALCFEQLHWDYDVT